MSEFQNFLLVDEILKTVQINCAPGLVDVCKEKFEKHFQIFRDAWLNKSFTIAEESLNDSTLIILLAIILEAKGKKVLVVVPNKYSAMQWSSIVRSSFLKGKEPNIELIIVKTMYIESVIPRFVPDVVIRHGDYWKFEQEKGNWTRQLITQKFVNKPIRQIGYTSVPICYCDRDERCSCIEAWENDKGYDPDAVDTETSTNVDINNNNDVKLEKS
jgi:hypothetical protein